jgi:sugar O-acyltransferase (sialic acid O-acetyltransferase NeuD family)
MKRLLIVGAGGFGREVLSFAQRIPPDLAAWKVAGFLDDNAHALLPYSYEHRVLGSIRDYQPASEDVLLLAIGDPKTKLRVASELRERGAKFASFVHPSAVIGNNVVLGEGVVICPHVSIPCDATLGDFVHVNTSSTIAHDTTVGDGCTLSGHCDLTGGARLGRGVFLGSHASVLPSVSVGDFARIGAGSIVLRSVPAGVTVFGVPAKAIS